jgi:hypothetical protein
MGLCRCKSGGAAEMRMVIAVAIELPDREHVQPGVHHGSQGQSACALDCLGTLPSGRVHAPLAQALASNLQNSTEPRQISEKRSVHKAMAWQGSCIHRQQRDHLRDERPHALLFVLLQRRLEADPCHFVTRRPTLRGTAFALTSSATEMTRALYPSLTSDVAISS